MKRVVTILSCIVAAIWFTASASGQWVELYATYDDDTNGTGYNTPSVAVFGENDFVAMVNSPTSATDLYSSTRNYLVPYLDADSSMGRMIDPGYGSATENKFDTWESTSGDIGLFGAWRLAAGPNNLVYVANNDAFFHAILVFEYTPVGMVSSAYRMTTGFENIFDIDVDDAGYVYIVADTSTAANTEEVKVFRPIGTAGTTWDSSFDDAPVTTIDLPEGSTWRGLTTNPDGSWIFLSDYTNHKVVRYVGGPESGYTLDATFTFEIGVDDVDAIGRQASPLGLSYYAPNNLLAVASDLFVPPTDRSSHYEYGRLYVVNPVTGTAIDTMDVAQWNFDHTGGYSNRSGGTVPGNASGYTSSYDVDWDSTGNVYSVSYNGWTVEKWHTDNLPVVDITAVEGRTEERIPDGYELQQNYPNPFNPSTTIGYALPRAERVRLIIYNLLGQEVRTLVDAAQAPGEYTVHWDGMDNHGLRVSAGVYLYRISAGEATRTRKMTLLP